jgi:hypothetical protein
MCLVEYQTVLRQNKDPRGLRVGYAWDKWIEPAIKTFNTIHRPCLGGSKMAGRFSDGAGDRGKAPPKNKKSGIDPHQRQKAIELKRKPFAFSDANNISLCTSNSFGFLLKAPS